MYSLPSVDNIEATGIFRGDKHDRQMLGLFIKSNSNIRIRKISGDNNLTYTMLNNDSRTEKSETITSDWKDISFDYDYTPFIKTLYKQNEPVKVEIEWDSSDKGIKELNYYYYGDDEVKFFEKWDKDLNSYAVVDGEALTVLIPYDDRKLITNHWKKGFKTLDDFLIYWKKVADTYDDMIGLEYNPESPDDQNVKTKFFVKANANGAGAAYYATDHIGVNKPSVASFFEVNWGGLHELGHGYQGSLGKGDLNIGEVSNNIFAHYVQINKDIYPFNDDWLGKLKNIEDKYNNIRLKGGSFKDLDGPGKLYFIINFLDSFEGADTYKKISKIYRHNVINKNDMPTQDAWVLGIYESYGVSLVDYFEAWGIPISEKIKLSIDNNNPKRSFSMADLVGDNELENKIIDDLKLPAKYSLVTGEALSKYNLSGNLNININIDNENLINGKYIVLKDGNKEILRKKINGNNIQISNIPVGVYKLILPEFLGSYVNNISNVIISNNKTTEKNIVYSNVENQIVFDNDVKVQFQGYYYNDAAEIKLLSDKDNNIKMNFRYRGTTLFNSNLDKNYEYAKIQVLDNFGNQVYLKKVGGKGEMFSTKNLEIEEIPVKLGYKLVLKYYNAKDKLKFISTLNNDYRTIYQINNSVDGIFIVTEDGLRPYNISNNDFYNEYIGRLKQYINKFINSVTEEEIYNKSDYKTEKSIIIRGYKKMNDSDKQTYKDLYDSIVNGAKPKLTFESKDLNINLHENIDLYSLVKAFDFEDGVLDKSSIKIETNLNINQPGTYEVKYIAIDSDNNTTKESIFINVLPNKYDSSILEQIIEYADNLDPNNYTIESYNTLKSELEASKNTLLREDLNQDIIDEQIEKLKNAINSLKEINKYIVKFETNCDEVIPDLEGIIENSKIERPKDPINKGFLFDGWYKDKDFNNIWNFDEDLVKSNTILYAKWTKLDNSGSEEIPPNVEEKPDNSGSEEIPPNTEEKPDNSGSEEIPPNTEEKPDNSGSEEIPPNTEEKPDNSGSEEIPPNTEEKPDNLGSEEIPLNTEEKPDNTNNRLPITGDSSIIIYITIIAGILSVYLLKIKK